MLQFQVSITNPKEESGTGQKNFFFDGAYGIDSNTEQIYGEIAYPLIEGVTEGYNGTIFHMGKLGMFLKHKLIMPSNPIKDM